MKKITNSFLFNDIERKRLLAMNIEQTLSTLFSSEIKSKVDLVERMSLCFPPGENLVRQTLLKGTFNRFSEKKGMFVEAIKQHTEISSKVIIKNSLEKTDVRFFPELITASRYSEQSEYIKQTTLNSETPHSGSTILSKIQSGNSNPDLNIICQINNDSFEVCRDIKSGNNMQKIYGVIGEVPYKEDGQLYKVLNKPTPLKDLVTLRNQSLDNYSGTHLKIQAHIATIHTLQPLLQQSEIIYNKAVQQEYYQILALDKKINLSSFYGIIVKEASYNQAFFQKLEPHITTEIFHSQKHFKVFMCKAILIYHHTVQPILSTIERTKNTEWEVSFLDDIKAISYDDI